MVLQSLYALECGDNMPDDDLFNIDEEDLPPPRSIDYARRLLALVREHQAEVDKQIARLAINWDFDRIAAIDRNILRLAIVELDHMPDVPIKVVLNEAIELAKKFSTVESSAFVNGILDKYAKEAQSARGE